MYSVAVRDFRVRAFFILFRSSTHHVTFFGFPPLKKNIGGWGEGEITTKKEILMIFGSEIKRKNKTE
jgi:hypothetical protein